LLQFGSSAADAAAFKETYMTDILCVGWDQAQGGVDKTHLATHLRNQKMLISWTIMNHRQKSSSNGPPEKTLLCREALGQGFLGEVANLSKEFCKCPPKINPLCNADGVRIPLEVHIDEGSSPTVEQSRC
jgi:hypothetical protein